MDDAPNNKRRRRLVTVDQMVNLPEYKWLTKGSARHLIFNAKPRQTSRGDVIPGNGFLSAIIRIGRKVLIDPDEFDACIDRQQEAGTASNTRNVEPEIDRREIGVVEAEAPTGTKANRPKGSAEVA